MIRTNQTDDASWKALLGTEGTIFLKGFSASPIELNSVGKMNLVSHEGISFEMNHVEFIEMRDLSDYDWLGWRKWFRWLGVKPRGGLYEIDYDFIARPEIAE